MAGCGRLKHDAHKKARAGRAFLLIQGGEDLLDLRFLVHDVLAYDWIEFLHFQFARHGAFVL